MSSEQHLYSKELTNILRSSLCAANGLDLASKELLERDEANYTEAIECHRKAYDIFDEILRDVPTQRQHELMLSETTRSLLDAVYAHQEYHFSMVSSIMTRHQSVANESRRKIYIESIRSKTLELSSLDINKGEKQTLERQFSHQEDLLDSLEKQCSHAISDELSDEDGAERLRTAKEMIDKLKEKNADCKQLLDGYVNEYIQLRTELADLKGEKVLPLADVESEQRSSTSTDELLYPFTNAGKLDEEEIQFVPLETPPEFEIPDDLSFTIDSPSLVDSC